MEPGNARPSALRCDSEVNAKQAVPAPRNREIRRGFR